MNHNINLKCKVCGNVVRLKIYGGYELKNPFAFSCPKCKITIQGHLTWNEDLEKGFINEFKCNNASLYSDEGSESHLLQIATEFFTDKIKAFKMTDPTMFFSPFMMDQSSFEIRQRKVSFVQHITQEFEEQMTVTLRIWELFKNKNYMYLNRQLLDNGFVKPVILGELLKIDYPQKILEVLYSPFFIFFSESGRMIDIFKLRKMLNNLKQDYTAEVTQLSVDLQELLEFSDENVIYLMKNFGEYYRFIWPIILSDIYKTDDIDKLKEKKGILTSNFETLKNYYVEAFEVLSSLLPIFLGIQNIIKRGSRNNFEEGIKNKFPQIDSIKSYEQKVVNKGNKVKFFEYENIFNGIFDIPLILNNSIRNSIGHHSYTYEPDKQLINFIDRNKNFDLYLIEFCSLLYKTFYATFLALELIMFLKKQ